MKFFRITSTDLVKYVNADIKLSDVRINNVFRYYKDSSINVCSPLVAFYFNFFSVFLAEMT